MRRPNKREWMLIALALAGGISVVVVGAPQRDSDNSSPAVAEVAQKPAPGDGASRSEGAGRGEGSARSKGPGNVELAQALTLDSASLKRSPETADPDDAFGKKSWYVPPPPLPVVIVPPPPPPPPTAPPLPFTFTGRYMENDKPVFFLTAGDRLLIVHTGEVIDGTYRVDGIVGGKLNIMYLPLNIKQELDAGGAG